METENQGRESQITGQMSGLDAALNSLETAIEKLEVRLESVLRSPSTTVNETKEKEEQLVSLAETIRQRSRLIRASAGKLRSLHDRIEL